MTVTHRVVVKEDLKKVYKQNDEAGFRKVLEGFKEKRGRTYREIVRSWEAGLEHLVSYLRYPPEIRWLIYSTNPLERFIKEVKRRVKVIEVFRAPDACSKVIYLLTRETNERYRRRVVPQFCLAKDALLSIRRRNMVGSRPLPRSYLYHPIHKILDTMTSRKGLDNL